MTSFLTQILGSGTAKYFADASGNPFMVKGEMVWGLLSNAGITSGHTVDQDITDYFSTRQGQGYNTVVVAVPMCSVGGNPGVPPTVTHRTGWPRSRRPAC